MDNEITLKDVQRYAPADNDILILTTPAGLSWNQRDVLDIQLKQLSAMMLREHGKNVSTLVLPGGFDVKILSKQAERELGASTADELEIIDRLRIGEIKVVDATFGDEILELAAIAVDREWREHKGLINCTEVCAIIRSVSARYEKKAGLRFGDYLSHALYEQGKNIRRASWPAGDHLSADGAEGGTLWYYASNGDEFIRDYKLGFHELGATDWEIID